MIYRQLATTSFHFPGLSASIDTFGLAENDPLGYRISLPLPLADASDYVESEARSGQICGLMFVFKDGRSPSTDHHERPIIKVAVISKYPVFYSHFWMVSGLKMAVILRFLKIYSHFSTVFGLKMAVIFKISLIYSHFQADSWK